MEAIHPSTQVLSDFIYYYPEVVVKILNKNGYPIDMKTATLTKINRLVFEGLYYKEDIQLANDLDLAIQNEGQSGFITIILAAVALISSLIGTFSAKSSAKKQRELLKNLALADLAHQEKIQYENIRTQAETDRIEILSRTLLDYRKALQTESTARIKDTWLYLTALGIGMGIFYGLYLITAKK